MKETQTTSLSRNKLLWFFLLSLGGLTYFARYRFVPALKSHSTILAECPDTIYNHLQYTCDKFDIQTNPVIAMEITGVEPSYQFVVLEAFPVLSNEATVDSVTLEMDINSFAVNQDRQILSVLSKENRKTIKFPSSSKNDKEFEPMPLTEVPRVTYDHYIVTVKLLNTDKIQDDKIHDIKLGFITANPKFNRDLSYFKGLLFSIAVISWFIYQYNLSDLPSGYALSEQKWTKHAGFFLIFFDQWFVSYSTLSKSFTYLMIDVIIVATLTTIIVIIWFCVLERLSSSTNTISSNSQWAIGFFAGGHFILIITAFGTLAADQAKNPLVDFQNDKNLYVTLCKYYLYVIMGIGSLWTVVRACQILAKFRHLDWRDGSAFTFSFYYILCYGFFLASGTLQVFPLKGERVVLLFGITTLYIVLLQVIYAPFSEEVDEAEQRKKYNNPELKGQYDDLTMNDESITGTSSQKDNIKLKMNDVLKKKVAQEEEEDEEEDVDV